MFNVVRRSLVTKALMPALRMPAVNSARAFCVAAVRQGGDHHGEAPVILQGPGAAANRTPTSFDQSTGDERREHLAAMEGKVYYDMEAPRLAKKGTKAEPTIVPSGSMTRLVGCTGAPGEGHDLMWIVVDRTNPFDRCPECGNVFKLSEKGFDPEDLSPAHHHGHD
ncbi:Cytochrome c oxidase subunit 4 [Coemansia thaxteri]|nr:Cytochrome c oxidase subunit 4 [Coemansia thaxteri]KAJ2471057.1 Cytochrome c oxidase subunit 4 [Coemansia sp. RSA 2322]KAJ2482179.1 Cytochrome c oxidase subunit 4 [Coemansia sp. RSA 2320]